MCGLILHLESFNNNGEIKNLLSELNHRGPDEQTIIEWNHVSLGFCRLAIREIDEGSQPFVNSNFISAINGELFNEKNLIEELKNRGKINPKGDMKILASYLFEFGMDNLSKVDGQFAGLIIDKERAVVTIFRDRFGEKPLFYCITKDLVYVSSEISQKYLINLNKFSHVGLMRGFWMGKEFPFTELIEVEPATYIEIDLISKIIIKKEHFGILKSRKIKKEYSEKNELATLFERKMREIIESRCISDVPISILLSGGIDSALITALLPSQIKKEITAFTLSITDSVYDESAQARKIADQLLVNHSIIKASNESLAEKALECVDAMDTPILDPASLSLFYLCSEVKKDFKVSLTGDGGDELFNGYTLQKEYKKLSFARNLHFAWIIKLYLFASRHSPSNNQYLSLRTKLERVLDVIQYREFSIPEVALSPFAGTALLKKIAEVIFDKKLKSEINVNITADEYYKNYVLPQLYLIKSDRMSMSNGLELRSPFLSFKLTDFLENVPETIFKTEVCNKKLSRAILSKYLTHDILNAPKHGFSAPFHSIKKFLSEPEWNLEHINIDSKLASTIWNMNTENSGFASWALFVLNRKISQFSELLTN